MPLYWAWADSDRLLVHSGGDGPGAFLGEVALDGSTAADLGVQPGDFRAPARSRDGRYRGYIVPATDAPEHVVVEGSDGSDRHEVPVLGGGVVGFGPDGDELAFIAPAKAGPPVTVPVGPLRVVDAGSGAVRTLQPGNVVAFFWSPNGRTIAAFRIGAPDDTVALARSTAAGAPRHRGLALDLVFVDAASGVGPVANAGATGRYVHRAGPPLLRPVRAEPPALGAGLERDRRCRSSPTTRRPGGDHPAGRLGRAADRRPATSASGAPETRRVLVHISCAHYLCK